MDRKTATQWARRTFEKLDKKFALAAADAQDKIPYTTHDGKFWGPPYSDIGWWTNGFWGGLNWLLYAQTKNPVYKTAAEKNELFLDAVFHTPWRLDHDAGFIWHLSAGLDYKLTGSQTARARSTLAAMSLCSRFNRKGNYVRAWNNDDAATWSIVDCMMNLPLLFWASEQCGDDRFWQIAVAHADMAMAQHVREDGSVRHIVVHDPETGAFVKNLAGQGYSENSCWSRGAAWALYGFAIAHAHTGKREYLQTAQKVADRFIQSLEKTDYLPLTDFDAPATPEKYDATAGACAACGMLELSKALGEKGEKYFAAAVRLLQRMDKEWCDYSDARDGVLQNGMEAYSSQNNMYLIYGDFFFTEAVTKLLGSELEVW